MTMEHLQRADNVQKLAIHKIISKFNAYYLYMVLINLLAIGLAFLDPKGIFLLIITIGVSLNMHLSYSKREEQRLTNDLLEEILYNKGPLR